MDSSLDKVLIEEDLVFLEPEVKNKEEVIRLLGEKLKEKGYVKEDFIKGVLEREEIFPTGLPFEIPVALPHTDAKYCNKTAFAIAILKEPIKFREMGDPEKELDVRIVVLLSLDDPKSQVKWLKTLINVFQNTELLKRVTECKNRTEAWKLLKGALI